MEMEKYVEIIEQKEFNSLAVCFMIEKQKPLEIGNKMAEINEEAYMNGYNWEVFFDYYLSKNNPDILEGMEADPEAGAYVVCYELSDENRIKAEKFVKIIVDLIENEEKLYEIVKNESNSIEWD
jgi:hypothetical protein